MIFTTLCFYTTVLFCIFLYFFKKTEAGTHFYHLFILVESRGRWIKTYDIHIQYFTQTIYITCSKQCYTNILQATLTFQPVSNGNHMMYICIFFCVDGMKFIMVVFSFSLQCLRYISSTRIVSLWPIYLHLYRIYTLEEK